MLNRTVQEENEIEEELEERLRIFDARDKGGMKSSHVFCILCFLIFKK